MIKTTHDPFALNRGVFLAYSNGANDNFKGVASLFGSKTVCQLLSGDFNLYLQVKQNGFGKCISPLFSLSTFHPTRPLDRLLTY